MGNFCICAKTELCSEVRVFTKKEEIIRDDSQRESAIKRNLSKIQNDNQHTTNENSIMAEIKQYFNIDMKQFQVPAKKKEKDKKIKKMMSNKKAKKLKMAHTVINNQYELMLKRLLEQKKIERKGPKRRETIRKENNIKIIINDVIEDFKNKKSNKKLQTDDTVNSKNQNSLLIKKQNVKLSMTIDKNDMKNMLRSFQNKGKRKSLCNSITVSDIFFHGVNKLNSMKYSDTLKRDSSVV